MPTHGKKIDSSSLVAAHCYAPQSDNHSCIEAGSSRPLQTSQNLAAIIRGFKAATTLRINKLRNTPKRPIWQRNYYEHIIRNELALEKIRHYIFNNAYTWEKDRFF